MPISKKDREILRGLAKRVAEIAALPVQAERIALWKKHNALKPVRPMILVFPEGSWRELLPDSALECKGKEARGYEYALRRRIYTHDHFRDDTVCEGVWFVPKAVDDTGWGLEEKHIASTEATGAFGFDPVIRSPKDLKKLRKPEVLHDEKKTQENLAQAHDLFDGILDVQLKGIQHVSFHLMGHYIHLRGLNEILLDMYENPQMLHDAMAFFEEGCHGLVRQWREMNLLDLNNDNTYQNSGGNSWTDELPRKNYDPKRIEPADMWASAESQEMALVSPEMHWDFAMQYEARLLEPWGLTGCGCCEDLTLKMDYVRRLPRLRRISIAPCAPVDRAAPELRGDYIFSWKAQPSMLVGKFNEKLVRDYIRHTLDVAKEHGCVLEMILKDTHTCENHPERFTRWTEIARGLVGS